MEESVRQIIDGLSLPFFNNLIQNQDPMNYSESLQKPLVILRWRNRVCQTCSESFDISHEGRFYRCGRCLP
jgi:ribosomal protein S27AE